MGSQQRQDREISTDSVTEGSAEVRIDVEAPPGVELAPEDKDTRQINTQAIVNAAFEADEDDDDLGFDRPLFDAHGKASTPEMIASMIRQTDSQSDTPRPAPKRPATPMPECAFDASVVVASQAGDDPLAPKEEDITARRLKAARPRPSTGPHFPAAGSARIDRPRRPLTGPMPALLESTPPSTPHHRGFAFLLAGAVVGILIGLGVGLLRDRSRAPNETLSIEPQQDAPPAAPIRDEAPEKQKAKKSAHPLAIPGSVVQLQRLLKLTPKEFERLKEIREHGVAKRWAEMDAALAQLSPTLNRTMAIQLWRVRIDRYRGNHAEARQACSVLLSEKLDPPWPAEVEVTLAESELALGNLTAAHAAAKRAKASAQSEALIEQIDLVLDRLPAKQD